MSRFASIERILVGSDYDGCLAQIVEDPAAAMPDESALEALRILSQLPATDVAIISGRSLTELERLVGAKADIVLVGTHGAEREAAGLVHHGVEAVATTLGPLAESAEGVKVEVKPSAVAVHYRQAPDQEAAVHEQMTQLATETGGRLIPGKMVYELVFGSHSKGSAVEALRSEFRAGAVFFIGDDTTDEDVFEQLAPPDVGVKVGEGHTSAAFRIAGQSEVAPLLHKLASLRRG